MSKEKINTEQEDFDEEEIVVHRRKEPVVHEGVTAARALQVAAAALEALRAKHPLVQCMTNFVSAEIQANALLALGASPVMTEDMGEASQFTTHADALLVNVGTVTKQQADAMRAAVSHANMGGRPWVLDPVGVGALPLRTFTAKELMRRFPAIIRGNASEISFLVSNEAAGRGVDSTIASDVVAPNAGRLAGVTHAAVLVSGAVDFVSAEGYPLVSFANGSPLMARTTGLGCAQGAVCAAFLGALGGKARWESAVAAALTMAVAGEMAAANAKGPGSFVPAFLDALDALRPDDLRKLGKAKLVG